MNTPLSEDDIKNLKVGETVYLSGTIFIARDEAHLRALEFYESSKELPVDFKGGVIFHCGPIVRKEDRKILAAGPTTSARMNSMEPKFIELSGIRAILGKGGMSKDTVDAMKKFGCVYFAFTGGAAVLAAKGLENVKDVFWLDLGMPEALWVVEANNFGPLVVAIDASGNSLYDEVSRNVSKNLADSKKILGLE